MVEKKVKVCDRCDERLSSHTCEFCEKAVQSVFHPQAPWSSSYDNTFC